MLLAKFGVIIDQKFICIPFNWAVEKCHKSRTFFANERACFAGDIYIDHKHDLLPSLGRSAQRTSTN